MVDSMADFTDMCRVCMCQDKNLTSIFSSAAGYSHLYTIIMECAPVQIRPDDNLPTFICGNCLNNLDIAYRFKDLCTQSDVILRRCLSAVCEVKNEPIDEMKLETDCSLEPSTSNDEIKGKTSPFSVCEMEIADDFFKDDPSDEDNVEKNTSDIENEIAAAVTKTPIKKKRIRIRGLSKRDRFDYSVIKMRSDGRYQCDMCESHYKSKYHLKRHKVIHLPQVCVIKCDLCGKCFTRKEHLNVHRRIHTGERTCSCEFCGKTFYSINGLRTHRRIHLDLKPYVCKFCSKCFTQNKTLKNHMRTHTGERPFICETCGKSFNRRHHLTTHNMMHTGEKRFNCEFCGQAFALKQHLNLHKVKHTGQKPYTCEKCNRGFMVKSKYVKHMSLTCFM